MKRSNKQTNAAQAQAAKRYALARGLYLERIGGTFSPIDYVAKDSPKMGATVVEVVEIKCRLYTFAAFPNVWMERRKVEALLHWQRFYDCTGVFVVEWVDGVMARIAVDDAVRGREPVRRWRADRQDDLDTDTVYEVPVDRMEVVP